MSETANPDSGSGRLSLNAAVDSLLASTPAPAPEPEERDDEPVAEAIEDAEATAESEEGAYEANPDDEADDDADDVEASDADDEEEPRYSVKIDGEEFEVTLDELRNGYQRERDYRRKTEEVAQQRREAEERQRQVEALEQQYAARLQEFMAQASQQEQEPDWDALYQEDPIEYVHKRAEWDRQQKQRQEQQQRAQAEMQQLHRKRLHEASQDLMRRIPDWSDPEKAKTEKAAVMEYGQKVGFTQQELATSTDPRAIEVLRKAWLYDQLQGKKPAVEKKVRTAPKMAKSGTPTTSADSNRKRVQQAEQRLRKSGKIDAAVDLLMMKQKGR